MARIVVGLFETPTQAHNAVDELFRNRFEREEISVLAHPREEAESGPGDEAGASRRRDVPGGSGPATGMGVGAALGGLGGLLVGLGMLAIPGIGPLAAAGPLATALAGAGLGAVGGALVGALVQLGIPEDEAQHYAEGVRRGGTVVAVRTEDEAADRAAEILESHGAVDLAERVARWREEGWERFDPAGAPYGREQLRREAERPGATAPRRPGVRCVRIYVVQTRRAA